MRRIFFALSALFYGATLAAIDIQSDPQEFFSKIKTSSAKGKRTWVLLAAGSKGFDDYRHQADVCHAYHVLIDHGIPAENIITMMVDDIAYNRRNRYRGKIFNDYRRKDVYSGVKIDYRGADVTPANFLAVLSGQKSAVKGGNGRVIESTKDDNIFVYFCDHGSPNYIIFPYGYLSAWTLNRELQKMHQRKRFANLVFYLETCFSGSMFIGRLRNDKNIYALTAANSTQYSYACFCGRESMEGTPCLADCFSYQWITHSALFSPSTTLEAQYKFVKLTSTLSEVSQYGNKSIAQKPIGEFQGSGKKAFNGEMNETPLISKVRWPSRDVPILYAEYQLEQLERMNSNPKEWMEAATKVRDMKMKRTFLDDFMQYFVKTLVPDAKLADKIMKSTGEQVKNFDCSEDVFDYFFDHCFNPARDSYALSKTYLLANLCENGVDAQTIIGHMKNVCPLIDVHDIA